MNRKVLSILLLLSSLGAFSFCTRSDIDPETSSVCLCGYPSWAQLKLKELNNQDSFYLLLYKSGSDKHYAITDIYDSNKYNGVTFYDREGKEILRGSDDFETLFDQYARTGGFIVCNHQFDEPYFTENRSSPFH